MGVLFLGSLLWVYGNSRGWHESLKTLNNEGVNLLGTVGFTQCYGY